jgi:hypothetical protein
VPSLRDLQARFCDAVLLDDGAALAGLVRDGAVPAQTRIEVYRNNAREGFRKALAADYPVVERLVGAACFRGLARDYLRAHPSRSGDLQHFGRDFAEFLRRIYGGSEYAYLADVARLEWAYQQVLLAPDATPAPAAALATCDPEALEHVRLRLHPASDVVRSAYPLLRIWEANQDGADPEARVDLASGPDAILLRRLEAHVELRRIGPDAAAFIDALRTGQTLDDAIDAGFAQAHDFRPVDALVGAFALGLVVDCSLPLLH